MRIAQGTQEDGSIESGNLPTPNPIDPRTPGMWSPSGVFLSLEIAGILLLVGGIAPLALGPGYSGYASPPVITSIALPAITMVLLGSLLIGYGFRRGIHPRSGFARSGQRLSAGLLVASSVVATSAVLLTFGIIPGLYYGTTGSDRFLIVGCGGAPPGEGPGSPGFPGGFPPYSHVHLQWEAQNGTAIFLIVTESPPNSQETQERYLGSGPLGSVSIVGSGGEATWVAVAQNASSCTSREFVQVNWWYTAFL